jgi:hypothetical protein
VIRILRGSLKPFKRAILTILLVQDSGIPLVLIARENPASSVALSPEEFVPENPFEKLLLHESEGEEPIDKK